MIKSINEPSLTLELKDFVLKWKTRPGNLIMILHKIQEHYGYLPKSINFELAKLLDVPIAKIYGVISFYHFFKLSKPGKHNISVCTGTACYLKGALEIIEELEKLLRIKPGEVTEDNEFSIEVVRCIGCCGLAPVIKIDDKIYRNVKKDQLRDILSKFRGSDI